MNNLDINQFLNLPDWKKVQLKIKYGKFNDYPMQTADEESNRINMIISMCAHFANKTYNEYIENKNGFDISAFCQWPGAMNLFITPKLLNIIEFEKLIRFGYCLYCCHFEGHNKLIKSEIPIVSIYGNCKLINKRKYRYRGIKNTEVFKRVQPNFRCISWSPVKIYITMLDLYIRNLLIDDYPSYYNYEDYKKDLRFINIVDYFVNQYQYMDF